MSKVDIESEVFSFGLMMLIIFEVFEEKINGIRLVWLLIDGGMYVLCMFFDFIYLVLIL